jgi:hypothetical protein
MALELHEILGSNQSVLTGNDHAVSGPGRSRAARPIPAGPSWLTGEFVGEHPDSDRLRQHQVRQVEPPGPATDEPADDTDTERSSTGPDATAGQGPPADAYFGFRAERRVFSYGVTTLALLSAAALLLVDADTQRLLLVFAIGVLIGFTISQPPGKCHARGGLT